MDGIKLQIDPEQLAPLIRQVVAETLAHLGGTGAKPENGPSRGETPAHPGALLLKPREAAAALGISERTLWDLTRENVIPHVRIGRAVRYAPDDLRAWIDRARTAGTAAGPPLKSRPASSSSPVSSTSTEEKG